MSESERAKRLKAIIEAGDRIAQTVIDIKDQATDLIEQVKALEKGTGDDSGEEEKVE